MPKKTSHPPPSPEGVALKRERERAKLSQRALAERSGLPHGWIGEIESGARQAPDLATLKTLATAIGVPIWAIVEDAGEDVSIDEAIAAYLADPLSKREPPDAAELEWLRRRGLRAFAFGGAAPALAVHLILEAHRAKSRR
jgi:transcriptional regulator with XRE-family HTH domain